MEPGECSVGLAAALTGTQLPAGIILLSSQLSQGPTPCAIGRTNTYVLWTFKFRTFDLMWRYAK